jgi:hypothetical protein
MIYSGRACSRIAVMENEVQRDAAIPDANFADCGEVAENKIRGFVGFADFGLPVSCKLQGHRFHRRWPMIIISPFDY